MRPDKLIKISRPLIDILLLLDVYGEDALNDARRSLYETSKLYKSEVDVKLRAKSNGFINSVNKGGGHEPNTK